MDITKSVVQRKRIAFVAHNHKKAQMTAFVGNNKEFIDNLDYDIVTTGSTGDRLEEVGLNIYKKYRSGAHGGDFDIGSRINEGKIVALFFFLDPLSSHAHEADISGLLRLCNVHNIPVATNPVTAEMVLEGLKNKK